MVTKMWIRTALGVSLLPFLVYALYGELRIAGIQPPQETGLSEFITTAWFLMGAAVCYFVAVTEYAYGKVAEYWRWVAPAALLILLAADETFMIHENLQHMFDVTSSHIFFVYGLFLLYVLYLFRFSGLWFWLLIGTFILFAGTSQLSDSVYGEGVIYLEDGQFYLDRKAIENFYVDGRYVRDVQFSMDYEQIFESFAAFGLAMAFCVRAVFDLKRSG